MAWRMELVQQIREQYAQLPGRSAETMATLLDDELYDLQDDPGEFVNLWEHAESQELKRDLLLKFVYGEMAKAPLPNPLWFSRGTAQEQPARHDVLHEVMAELAAERPGDVYVVDLIEYFDDAGITTDVDTRPDGVHVTPEAAQSIAENFLGEQMVRAALDLF